jgi:heat shock protein HslJ
MRTLISVLLLLVLSVGLAQGSLGNSSWELQRIGTKTVTAQEKPTIRFGADRADVFFGCNTGGGAYTLKGRSLKIGPLVSTKKACGEPLDDLEREYVSALAKVTGYAVSAAEGKTVSMSLVGPGVILRFTPKP